MKQMSAKFTKAKKKLLFTALAVVMIVTSLVIPVYADNETAERYDARMSTLTALLAEDQKTLAAVEELGKAIAFLSVSDGESRATTVYASGNRLETALERVLVRAKYTGIEPKWLKLDVVTSIEEKSYAEFRDYYAEGRRGGSLRKGIAFNDYFGRAILESELNSGGYFSYETGELDLKAINTYFKANHKKLLDRIPETIWLFETKGYFTDGEAYPLLNGKNNTKARRDYATDPEGLTELMKMSSAYLGGLVGEDGRFIYGYYPIANTEIEGYSIIRHAGTVWNMVLQYDVTRDPTLLKAIDRAMGYLLTQLQYKDQKTAFLVSGNELNIGGNGITLLALTSYAEIVGTDRYNAEIEALANGVLYMQKADGSFTHAMRADDYTVSRDYIIVFFDGEAMYGMLKAYGVLGKSKYLNGAKKAADYFIANNYEEQHSHWIAYGFNELTKYAPLEKYFAFGLRNVSTDDYLTSVRKTKSGSPTRAETMGAAFELYDRLVESGIECDELANFNAAGLIEAFEARIDYGLNYFMFPEYAMYFANPTTVLGSFAIREDLFRIRIDDIQHFMGGYYLYYKNYDRVQQYKENNAQ
ncbi:MAG: hypothetical protein NC084_05075 [Bacteroides sp.]|nr:hypothetical protein [Eubacterium sp.]MCM1418473.1 hypothetical protein [Roseburia sp.]MCM1462069.1 hypothetical protein [Bacteroides sp.]